MLVENSKTIYEHDRSNYETTDPLHTSKTEFKTEIKPTEEGEIGCKKPLNIITHCKEVEHYRSPHDLRREITFPGAAYNQQIDELDTVDFARPGTDYRLNNGRININTEIAGYRNDYSRTQLNTASNQASSIVGHPDSREFFDKCFQTNQQRV